MTIIVEIGCRRSDTLCELSQLETCKMLTLSAHCSIVFVVLVNVGFVQGAFRDVDGAVPYGKCGFCQGWRCFRGSAEPAGAKRKRAYPKIGSRRFDLKSGLLIMFFISRSSTSKRARYTVMQCESRFILLAIFYLNG